jgi:hypothetical protein
MEPFRPGQQWRGAAQTGHLQQLAPTKTIALGTARPTFGVRHRSDPPVLGDRMLRRFGHAARQRRMPRPG